MDDNAFIMMVKSLDDVDVDITFCDAGYAPGSTPNPILNTSAVWCRPTGGEWIKSPYRSAIQTAHTVRRTAVKDLMAIFSGKEILHEGSKAGSGGSSTDDATKLQSLQGHSSGDADQGSTGKP